MMHLKKRALETWRYCSNDVWNDTRHSWKVSLVKTLNLFVKSFLNGDLQTRACSLTYRTMLAIVPALAMICAIARGFGFQTFIENQLIAHFPAQKTMLTTSFNFVDSYLKQASGGVFVGVGVIFLIWTLISLIRNVEESFNKIWYIEKGRSIWRMTTDYLAILLVLPILMICASGLSLFVSSSFSKLLPYDFMKPALSWLFDFVSLIFSWLFFAGTYMLIPNTKVKFKNAIVPGILVGTAYSILQWLFVGGQLYVAKYNAIYGSFSFLPLFLIWMQLVWLITLIGAVLCYSIQNIGEFNFGDNIRNMSADYRRQTTFVVLGIICRRFHESLPAMTPREISQHYRLPINLVVPTVSRLISAGILNYVEVHEGEDQHPVQPAIDVSRLTVGKVIERLQTLGDSGFLPGFDKRFSQVRQLDHHLLNMLVEEGNKTLILDLHPNLTSTNNQINNTQKPKQ